MTPRKIDSPFIGLVPYSEEDAEFFFGRERDQQRILANLFASRLTILYGASGVGKSSVLRAGIIREVRERIEAARKAGETPELAVVYFKEWKGDILAALFAAIRSALDTQVGGRVSAEFKRPLSLKQAVLKLAEQFNGDLLLIFDQFEEYFLYHPGPAPDEFALELAEAANHAGLGVNFLLALRDDAVSRVDRFKALIPGLFSNYLRLNHLSGQDAHDAIVKPVERYNSLPDERKSAPGTFVVEPDLPKLVMDEVYTGRVLIGQVGHGRVAAATAAKAIETPYLQIVMTRLWRTEVEEGSRVLRTETLKRLGGAEAIVKGHLESVLQGLTSVEQDYCACLFTHLVTPSGTKIAHTLGNLATFAKVEAGVIAPLLEKLASSEKRILAPVAPPDGQPGQLQFEIYHDSLAQAVLSWKARYEAERERRERAAEKRRLVKYVIAFGLAFLIAAAGGGIAVWQWRAADEAKSRAQRAEASALAARAEADAAANKLRLAEAVRMNDQAAAERWRAALEASQHEATSFRQQATSKDVYQSGPTLAEVLKERDTLKAEIARMSSMQRATPPPQGKEPPYAQRTIEKDPIKAEPKQEQYAAPPPEQKPEQKREQKPEQKPGGKEEASRAMGPSPPLGRAVIDALLLGVINPDLSSELARYVAVKTLEQGKPLPQGIEMVLRRSAGAIQSVAHGLEFPTAIAMHGTKAAITNGQRLCFIDTAGGTRNCFVYPTRLIEWFPDGHRLAAGGVGLALVDPVNGAIQVAANGKQMIAAMSVASSGVVAYAFQGSSAIQFYPPSEKPAWENKGRVAGLAFRSDKGDSTPITLASVDENGVIRVWEYASNKVVHESPRSRRPYAITWTARGGDTLAVASDRGVELYQTSSGKRGRIGSRPVYCYSFTPDGRRFVTCGGSILTLWAGPDLAGTYLGRFASFTPDGHRLAVVDDQNIKLYPGEIGDVLAQMKAKQPRPLTAAECKEHLGLDTCPVF